VLNGIIGHAGPPIPAPCSQGELLKILSPSLKTSDLRRAYPFIHNTNPMATVRVRLCKFDAGVEFILKASKSVFDHIPMVQTDSLAKLIIENSSLPTIPFIFSPRARHTHFFKGCWGIFQTKFLPQCIGNLLFSQQHVVNLIKLRRWRGEAILSRTRYGGPPIGGQRRRRDAECR